ncbi:MAG: hypothetical protein ACI8W8_003570, partial [Rhodothermales bacterium]
MLPGDVALRGGFAGHEDAASERVAGNKSSLSGDIQHADVATDNCFHVLRSSGPGYYTLDALEVCDGQAEAPAPVANGAGFLGEDGIALTVTDCLFRDHSAAGDGGHIWLGDECALVIVDTRLEGGGAGQDGGAFRAGNWGRIAHDVQADITLQNVEIANIQAAGDGGAFRAGNWGHVVATGLTIEGATAGGSGGAFRAGNWGRVTGSDWQISDTTAATNGGLAAFDEDAFI